MKITSGKFKGRKIKTLFDTRIRPTMQLVRETVFNICRDDILEARVLDLFAGTGAIGLEALSRGADFVIFIDKSSKATRLIRENIENFAVQDVSKVYCQEAKKALFLLGKNRNIFDFIYIDPPYHLLRDQLIRELCDAIVSYELLRQDGHLFIEGSQFLKPNDLITSMKIQSGRELGETVLLHYR